MKILQVVVVFCAVARCVTAATLQWNVSTNLTDGTPSLAAGYRVYTGQFSRSYERTIDVGTNLSWHIDRAPLGTVQFYAVTAYDTFGLESEFSDEVQWTRRTANLRIKMDATDNTIDILATTDFATWTAVCTITPTQTGSMFFVARSSLGASSFRETTDFGSKKGKL